MIITDLETAGLYEEQCRKRLNSVIGGLLDNKTISQDTYDRIWKDIFAMIDYELLKQKERLLWP